MVVDKPAATPPALSKPRGTLSQRMCSVTDAHRGTNLVAGEAPLSAWDAHHVLRASHNEMAIGDDAAAVWHRDTADCRQRSAALASPHRAGCGWLAGSRRTGVKLTTNEHVPGGGRTTSVPKHTRVSSEEGLRADVSRLMGEGKWPFHTASRLAPSQCDGTAGRTETTRHTHTKTGTRRRAPSPLITQSYAAACASLRRRLGLAGACSAAGASCSAIWGVGGSMAG
jgi:hypothetical protein